MKNFNDENNTDNLTKGPGGFETDNKFIEITIGGLIIAGSAALIYTAKGLSKMLSRSKINSVEINTPSANFTARNNNKT